MLLLLLLLLVTAVASWDIDVVLTQEASGAVGGEPFAVQPRVKVTNLKGILQTSILGTVSAELMESPSGYELLRRRNDDTDNGAEVERDDDDNTGSHQVEVIDGVATFAGLYIDEAGGGYRLRYIFRDEYGLTLGHVDASTTFAVVVGEPYRIAVTANPGRAYGGALFGDMPAVGVKDRGGNHLSDVNAGEVTVELIDDDGSASDLLLHADDGTGPTVPIEDGLAIFDGLYMKEARLYNRLRFTTTLSLAGPTVCESVDFTVGVGPAHELVVDLDASNGTVTGGRPFPYQPRVKVVDAGGNLLEYDHSSAVRVDIYSNPSKGVLHSIGGLDIDRNGGDDGGVLAPVVGGIVQFDDLSIDRVGIGYRLLYTFLKPDQYKIALVPSDIEILGDYFDVRVGSPHALKVLRGPTSTWAGNQPFAIQPRVAVVDAGGNVVSTGEGSNWTIQAYLTPSLAASSHHIPVPTTRDLLAESLNSVDVPSDLTVSSLSDDGIYAPGDVIQIAIDFPEPVVVDGEPFLALDVGRTTSDAAFAVFVDGSGTARLIFEYTVGLDQTSFDLDYLDVYSLKLDRYRDGTPKSSIRYVSLDSEVDANLSLPPPGLAGSLSANSDAVVDSRAPHIVSLTSSQIQDAKHSIGDNVSFLVEYSVGVVVTGSPYILLETGAIDRRAEFIAQVEPTILAFQYTVELGDEVTDLDYWTDEGLFRSSAASFQLNGGSIMRQSTSPFLPADLHLNPAQGFLDGTTSVLAEEGVATFTDLKIGRRGNDYKVRFRTPSLVQGVDLETTMLSPLVRVGPSAEYEIMGEPHDRNVGDRFGASAALDSNLLAIGAPGKRLPIPEIQVLTVSAQSIEVENEVQIIETALNVTEATKRLYRFASCADPAHEVQGTFTLSVRRTDYEYEYGQPLVVDSNIGPAELETEVMEAFPVLGRISVQRTPNVDCAADVANAWRWDVTLADASAFVDIHLEVDGGGLEGDGATMSETVLVQDTTMLEGSFHLVNPFNQIQSRQIPFDAIDADVKEAIEVDLGLAVQNVLVVDTDDYGRQVPSLGRRWTVTFLHFTGAFGDQDVNVPNLEAIGDDLTGIDAMVWTHTPFDGRSPLRGHFAISLRGCPFSAYLPHDASAQALKVALESLDSVNAVSVSPRTDLAAQHRAVPVSGSSWTVTFHSVNRETEYGWISDPGSESTGGNLPPLDVKSHLVGWNVTHKVDHVYGSDANDTQAEWMEKRMGDAGLDSGAVYVHSRENEQWKRETTVVAPDHTSMDQFGHSIDLENSFLAVGAPSKIIYGLSEQQTLRCHSSEDDVSGGFTVSFRGFTSDLIPHSAEAQEIETAIVGLYGETTRIHSLPRITVQSSGDEWDSGFCGASSSGNNNEVFITFLTPSDGDGVSTEWEASGGDIEPMTIDAFDLLGASVSISETRKGSLPSPIASGSVYLFERVSSTSNLSEEDAGGYEEDLPLSSWNQVTKLTPTDGLDNPTNSARFGWSVSLHVPTLADEDATRVLAIGSPGYSDESGKVYLFSSSAKVSDHDDDWKFHGGLTNSLWKPKPSPGDRLGEAIHLQGDTIMVGAPGHDGSRGVVYIFQRKAGGDFLPSQEILGPLDLAPDSMFGQSLSLSQNVAVICAPGQEDGGTCHVYNREDSSHPFVYTQQLMGSNILPGDRFGYSVAIDGPRMVVGQVQNFDGSLDPPRPVQTLEVHCIVAKCADIIGPVMHLSWREDDSGDQLQTERLPMNVSAIELRDALEGDLQTGQVSVKRGTLLEQHIGGGGEGYRWSVTFDDYLTRDGRQGVVPMLSCHTREPKLTCSVSVDQGVPQNVRAKAHVFTQDDANLWTEQALLYPGAPQRQDLLGSSVALNEKMAIVGAPNRETLNINSGSAIVSSLSFLDTVFDSSESTVLEGEELEVGFSRRVDDTEEQMMVGIKSMDVNADGTWQYYVSELYSFQSNELSPTAPVGILTGGTAGGGVDTSIWVDGSYDFSGRSDYASLDELILLERGQSSGRVLFETTGDSVHELPEESVRLQYHLPGFFASELGNLTMTVRIEDDGDGTMQYDKLATGEDGTGTGSSNAIDEEAGTMIVGDADGRADAYIKVHDRWQLMASLSLTSGDPSQFGESVAISGDAVVISNVEGAEAVVYSLEAKDWQPSTSLLPFDIGDVAVTSEHGFASSIAISDHVALVNCPSIETVFLFRKLYDQESHRYEWKNWQVLRSSEYGFDTQIVDSGNMKKHLHERRFGTVVAVDGRTVAISAPLSVFRRSNPALQEKVYIFSSAPHIQQITLRCDEIPRSGSFRLQLSNHPDGSSNTGISGRIPHAATPAQMKMALEEMSNVEEVEVSFSSTHDGLRPDKHHFIWKVAFVSIFADTLPLLEPIWDKPLVLGVSSTFEPQIDVATYSTESSFVEVQVLQGDTNKHDGFGQSLALSGDSLIVGAPFTGGNPRSSWDFEEGGTAGLTGWKGTGAINWQKKPVVGGEARAPPNLQGSYYIGTDNDGMGTLTSDPFSILGNEISLLVGGGCDHLGTYVELIVDSYPVLRVTGTCREEMDRMTWDVTAYIGRTGQIRIVDASNTEHINVDDIRFSWKVPIGIDESPNAGAAYIFTRHCLGSSLHIDSTCTWTPQERMVASDKRAGARFGGSVAIDDERGLVIVGSSNAPLYDSYHETPTMPGAHQSIKSTAISEDLEDYLRSGNTLSAIGGSLRLMDHLVAENRTEGGDHADDEALRNQQLTKGAGAVYVYNRNRRTGLKYWNVAEDARITPPDVHSGDGFGTTVSLDGVSAAIGAPGAHQGGGAAYFFDLSITPIRFRQTEYAVTERDTTVKIFLVRDERYEDDISTIGYSTSDLTARGVGTTKYQECIQLEHHLRKDCGDYEQTSGTVTFPIGVNEVYFTIGIVDDDIRERNLEYAQLLLHVPGGGLLQGEQYRAKLRIDDK